MPRRSPGARVVACVLGLAVASAASSGCRHGLRGEGDSKVDYRAALYLPSVGPTPYAYDELGDKPVVATFFATWCFPCLGQLPFLAELQQEYGARGLRVVAIGMDLDGAQVLEPFAQQFAYPFPVLVADQRLISGQSVFGPVKSLPTTVVLARDGSVVAAWAGLAEAGEFRAAVERAVGTE